MNEVVGLSFIIVGLIFDFIGCLGLVRFPDIYNRLQAATKCVTFGTCSILFGTFLITGFSLGGAKFLLAIVFVLLTSPTAAHALAKASCKAKVKLWEKSICNQYEEDENT